MPRKPINFELDFMIKDIFPRFTVKQFDDVSFNIKPKNQGLDYDTTGMTGKIFVGVNNDMFMQTKNITVSNNNINILLDRNMLQKQGRAYAEIELTDSNGTITSSSFIFDIDPKIGEGGQIPGEYEGFVEKYERLISEFKTQINSTINNCNSNVNTAIKQCNTSVDNKLNTVDSLINVKISDFEKRFNKLISSQQQDAEVIDARDGETSLKARLDRDIEKAKQVYINVEGSNISTDSSSGYLKDVEIKGNTIQDADNLADIRSVGEKVEGQELYEIPVLSVGKNLFDDKDMLVNKSINDNGNEIDANGTNTSRYIRIKSNTNYATSTLVWGRLSFYDENKKFLFNNKGSVANNIYVNSQTAKYVRVSFDVSSTNIQLEEGTVATPYEPYQEDKITILSPVQLEKVGDVADRIICKDGVWGVEKWINKIHLDVSTLSLYTPAITNNMFKTPIPYSSLNLDNSISEGGRCITTFGENLSQADWVNTNKEGIYIGKAAFGLVVSVDTVGDSTINRFNDYFKNKNHYFYRATENPQFIPLPHDQQVKLRTFANKTNISFGCEIEGTIKAQVPKSLGATVNTHTEQISNLNKELDRVKKLEESTVSTVTTESDFTTVEQTSNGYFEDVKLEGKTLVNLFPQLTKTWTEANSTTVYNSQIKLNELRFEKGKVYTCIALNLPFDKIDYIWFVNITTQKSKGNVFKFVADGSFDNQYLHIIYNGTSTIDLSELSNAKFIVLEGDHTQNPPSYFEGLKSVGQSASEDGTDEIVVSSVKGDGNLFDGEFEIGSISGSTGKDYNITTAIRCKGYIPINSDSVTLSCGTAGIGLFVYDSNKNFLTYKGSDNFVPQTITNENMKYIRIALFNTTDMTHKVMLNKGTTPIPYTPHQSDKKRLLYYNNETQTWEKPVLREWDSIEKHSDGKYYYHQRSGEIVLNGSENWVSSSSYDNDTTKLFRTTINDKVINYTDIIFDKFTTNRDTWRAETVSECGSGNSDNVNVYIRILKSKLPSQDVQGFKQWLQANNVTVVYQLAQEKVYECTNIDLITYANETNYIVESGVITPKSTLKVHNNISNVVSLLQKKVSLLESNMTNYMITQNRMQLASTYSADSVTFKVDYALCSEEVEYNEDLYNLILHNILVGKDNYDYDKMFTMVLDYASWNQISWEQFDILVGLMDIQHNPPIEEIPNEIM